MIKSTHGSTRNDVKLRELIKIDISSFFPWSLRISPLEKIETKENLAKGNEITTWLATTLFNYSSETGSVESKKNQQTGSRNSVQDLPVGETSRQGIVEAFEERSSFKKNQGWKKGGKTGHRDNSPSFVFVARIRTGTGWKSVSWSRNLLFLERFRQLGDLRSLLN